MISRSGRCAWFAIAGILALVGLAGPREGIAREFGGEVLLEGGIANPLGDLGDGWFTTVKGFGAETGYEVGLRFRYFMTPTWALAPAFHYVEFGKFNGIDPDQGPIQVETSVLRYGVDLQFFLPESGRFVRPFLTGGLGLCRNRYKDILEGDLSFFETSINTLAFSFGGGLRVGEFEISGVYTLNRFSTRRFSEGLIDEDYDWDYFVVRAGFAFPTD